MKGKSILCLLAFLCLSLILHSQSLPQLAHCHHSTAQGFFYFDENSTPLNAMFTIHRDSLLRHPMESVSLIRSWTDPQLQMDHLRYQQYYDGARVEGAEFSAHGKNGFLVFANGKLAHHFPHGMAGTLSEADALAFILAGLSGPFAWQDSLWEAELQTDQGNPAATYYPQGELLWALDRYSELHFSIPGNRYRLAWKFTIVSLSPFSQVEYYADAFTGEVFKRTERMEFNGPATILTQGVRTIDTHPQGFGFNLHATDGNREIRTKYYDVDLPPWGSIQNITDSDDDWGTDEQLGTTAHWMVTQAWDFFENTYGLAGMGNGHEVRVYANWEVANAAYDPVSSPQNYISFGTIDGGYTAVLDVAGHEYFHGIIRYSSDLAYEDESGALNESFADIFGTMVERFAQSGVHDWVMLAEVTNDSQTTRSLAEPHSMGIHFPFPQFCASATGQPDTYLEPVFWYTGTCDFGGVHVNSGVQNKWFYLLSDGGIHNGQNVNGIGADFASLIAYWTVVNVLQSSSQFSDSREASIATAGLLWGDCSNEQIQTANSWAAVGVGAPTSCPVSMIDPIGSHATSIWIGPNPVAENNMIQVKTVGRPLSSIVLTDMRGKQLLEKRCESEFETQVDLSAMPGGIFLISVVQGEKITTFKVTKP